MLNSYIQEFTIVFLFLIKFFITLSVAIRTISSSDKYKINNDVEKKTERRGCPTEVTQY